jgi:tetratricopeptide (TPR) repeat protein
MAYLKLGIYDKAMENVQHALDIFNQLSDKFRIAKADLRKGDIYLALKNYDRSQEVARIALEISQKNGYKEVIWNSAGLLHRIYLARKDTVEAYRYSVLENRWKDSLFLGEKQKTLTRLDLQYQFDKREQQLKAEKQRRNFFIIILVLCFVFSVIILLLLRTRYKMERKRMNDDLEVKNKELTLNVMSLMKKDEILAGITRKILLLEKESNLEETRSALKNIAKELQKISEKEIWDEFELRFKQVHSGFYERLLKKYPDLTSNELKLCALLLLNLSTKEICELTGQRPASLEVARSRLRKKLSITSSQTNLITFLTQI